MVDVIPTVLERILDSDPGGLIGVYLYGSSTTTGLGPESDIDLLLVTRVSLTLEERRRLVATLLELSGWKGHAGTFPEVVDRRPLEVTSVVAEDLDPLTTAPKRDFQFGEWLRTDVVAGRMPHAEHDPDLVVLLATALASHRVLHGPPLDSLVDDVPFDLLQDCPDSSTTCTVTVAMSFSPWPARFTRSRRARSSRRIMRRIVQRHASRALMRSCCAPRPGSTGAMDTSIGTACRRAYQLWRGRWSS
jgi:predicted nucleotidyltransferase